MSKLKSARTAPRGGGEPSAPAAGMVIDGSPAFRTWPLVEGANMTGVWAASPGHHQIIRDNGLFESFYILEGEMEMFEDGTPEPRRFGPGDLVVIEPGFRGSWKTLTPLRKVYFVNKS